MEFLEKIDLFPDNLNFHFKGNQHYKNKVGGLFSIIFILTFLLLSSFSIIDFFESNSKPSVINEQVKNLHEKLNLEGNNLNLNLAFYIISLNGTDLMYSNETYFELVNYFQNKNNLTFIRSNNEVNPIVYLDILNSNATFNSAEDDIYFSFKSNINLSIGEYIALHIEYSDISIDISNSTDPFSFSSNFILFTADKNYRKGIFLEISNVYVETDSGLLFSTIENSTKIFLCDNYSTDVPRSDEDLVYFSFYLKKSATHLKYIRKYKKLINLIPEINSNFSILFGFFRIISLYFKKKSINIKLLNKLFYFLNQNKKINNDYRKSSIINTVTAQVLRSNISNFSIEKANRINDEYLRQTATNRRIYYHRHNIIENLQMKRNNYFGAKDLISLASFNFCFKMSKIKNKKFNKALNIKNNFLNIDSYILKQMEFEFMKNAIFDDEQLKLFGILKIPTITLNNRDEISQLIESYQKFSLTKDLKLNDYQFVNDTQRAIHKINSKSQKSRIDLKLLNNIENL